MRIVDYIGGLFWILLLCFFWFLSASTDHRGTPEYPGRTVTLEPQEGARTAGCAYRVSGYDAEQLVLSVSLTTITVIISKEIIDTNFVRGAEFCYCCGCSIWSFESSSTTCGLSLTSTRYVCISLFMLLGVFFFFGSKKSTESQILTSRDHHFMALGLCDCV